MVFRLSLSHGPVLVLFFWFNKHPSFFIIFGMIMLFGYKFWSKGWPSVGLGVGVSLTFFGHGLCFSKILKKGWSVPWQKSCMVNS